MHCSKWFHEDFLSRTPFTWTQSWKARFELWSLTSNHLICAFEVILPTEKMVGLTFEQVHKLEKSATTSEQNKRKISLPAAISQDVRRAVMLDTVLKVPVAEPTSRWTPMSTYAESQVLSISNNVDRLVYKSFRDDIDIAEIKFHELATMKFSPTGRYLVIIRESLKTACKGRNAYGEYWLMQILRDQNFGFRSGPMYTCVACSVFFAVAEIAILSPSRGISFHPTQPRIAFPQVFEGLPQTYIWDFEDPIMVGRNPGVRANPFPFHDPPVFDPYFSDEGDYLCGTDSPLEYGFDEEVKHTLCIPIAVQVPEFLFIQGSSYNSSAVSRLQANVYQQEVVSKSTANALAERPKPIVWRANTLIFEKGAGSVVHVSQLQQLEKEGAVMMRTFTTDGIFKVQTMTMLPKSVKDCVDVSIVSSTPADADERFELDPQKVYLVLNKAHQKWYTADDLNDTTLPAVIESEKASIPTYVRTMNMAHGKAKGFELYYGVQRIGWKDDTK